MIGCCYHQHHAYDVSRLAATDDDKRRLTIEQVAERYSSAGHPRTIRTLQRYCVGGYLNCFKAPTKLGDMYLVTPESIERHLAELKEISATMLVATDCGKPRSALAAATQKQRNIHFVLLRSCATRIGAVTAGENPLNV